MSINTYSYDQGLELFPVKNWTKNKEEVSFEKVAVATKRITRSRKRPNHLSFVRSNIEVFSVAVTFVLFYFLGNLEQTGTMFSFSLNRIATAAFQAPLVVFAIVMFKRGVIDDLKDLMKALS